MLRHLLQAFGLALLLAPSASAVPVDLSTVPRDTLPAGTPLQLILIENLYSQRNQVGDEVVLVLAEDVVLLGDTYLVAGTPVLGRVTHQKPAQSWGRSGSLEIEVASVVAPYGLPIRVTEDFSESERSNLGEMVLSYWIFPSLVATGAVKGEKVDIPIGSEITLFTASDGVVLRLPASEKTAMVESWLEERIWNNFRRFSWKHKTTMEQAFTVEGQELTREMVSITPVGDHSYQIAVTLREGVATFSFLPFDDVHDNLAFKPLKATNELGELVIRHVS